MQKFLRFTVIAIVLVVQWLAGVNVGVSADTKEDATNQITALSLFDAAETVEIEESLWGPYVKAINGLEAEDPYYWAFYVNDEEASVGAGSYIPNIGDKLSFRYISWEDTSSTYKAEETIKIATLTSDSTALSLLQKAETVEVEESDWGPMITAINGLRAEGTYYWSFLINGEEALVGAGSYEPKAGEALTFLYKSWANDSAEIQPGGKIIIAGLSKGETPPDEGSTPENPGKPLPEGTPIEKAVKWIQNNGENPPLEKALALRLVGESIPQSYFKNIEKSVTENNGKFSRVTDLEKAVLGLIIGDKDPVNFHGINVIEQIYNNDNLTMQGLNGVVYGLIALDSKDFLIPETARWTRENIIHYILDNQLSDGGWSLDNVTSDVDMTAMTLSSLAKYQDDPNVKTAIDQAITWLTKSQQQNGSFLSVKGQENSQSIAQVIIALSILGISPDGEGFTKENGNVHSALLSFQNNNGGFSNLKAGSSELVSTGQGLLALVSYERYIEGKSSIYNLSALPPLVVEETSGNGNNNGGTTPTTPSEEKKQTISITVKSHQSTILPTRTMEVNEGATALSALEDALGSRVEMNGGYVAAIDGLAEFEHGPTSGWKYSVNGYFPSVGSGTYPLRNGDVLEWVYVLKDEEAAKEKASMGGRIETPRPESVSIVVFESLEKIQSNSQMLTIVLNKEQKMSAKDAEKLKDALKLNTVNVEKTIIPTEETVIASPKIDEAKIVIPKEALKEQKTIKVVELANKNFNTDTQLKSSIYEFSPKGTKFEKPVYISIMIPIENDNVDHLVMAWFNEETKQWVPIRTVVDAKTGTITSKIDHFTKFAVIDLEKQNVTSVNTIDITKEMEKLVQYLQKDQTESEWEDFGLARLNQADNQAVLASITKKLEEANGDFRKITDYERISLTVQALGGDATNIGGYNLIEKIYNNERMTLQGTNGLIFALIALDSNNYQVPNHAKWNREKILAEILANQNKDGGFSLVNGEASDVDITAMAISSLANYKEQPNVASAIDNAITWLSNAQQKSGGFIGDGKENSESTSQVIIALTSIGIDPQGNLFTKASGNVVSNLLSYQTKDGGFANLKNEASNQMASEQALLALIALDLFNNNNGSIYLFANQEDAKETLKKIPAFVDEKQISSYARQSVYEAFDKGIMYGVEKTPLRFAPGQALTRAQFTAILVKLVKGSDYEKNNVIFDDVKPGNWYYGVVMRAEQLGIIKGTSATTFSPNEPITREQVAVILTRAFEIVPKQDETKTIIYSDISNASDYNQRAIQALYDHNLMKGYEGNLFKPNDFVTREMGAVLAIRTAEKF